MPILASFTSIYRMKSGAAIPKRLRLTIRGEPCGKPQRVGELTGSANRAFADFVQEFQLGNGNDHLPDLDAFALSVSALTGFTKAYGQSAWKALSSANGVLHYVQDQAHSLLGEASKAVRLRFVGIASGLLLIIVAAASVLLWLRSAPRCEVAMTTVAVTNGPSAVRYATFRIANVGHSKVIVFRSYSFEIQSGKWRSELMPRRAIAGGTNMVGHLPPGECILAPGGAFNVTVALPFDDREWRVKVWYKALLTESSVRIDRWLSEVGISMPLWPEYAAYTGSKTQ